MDPFIRVGMAFLATLGAGLVGYLFVDTRVSSWYAGLAKPPLTPTDLVVIIVSLVLYFLMALALAIVWTKKQQSEQTRAWVRFYFLQLLLNAAWTVFFFGLHSALVAFVDVLFLGFTVLSLIASAWGIDRRAAHLMLPYLAWIFFAAYLSLGIWWLN
ncbi:MAG: TspO/MBR family protein [bacterium]|nr:TspO/MBR family protein [bacterium]